LALRPGGKQHAVAAIATPFSQAGQETADFPRMIAEAGVAEVKWRHFGTKRAAGNSPGWTSVRPQLSFHTSAPWGFDTGLTASSFHHQHPYPESVSNQRPFRDIC
jgi:hypothetical protein